MDSNSYSSISEKKLQEFMQKAFADISSSMSAMLVILGEKLGLYKAMAKSGPITSSELAARTNTYERYVREWLANQAASGYVIYDPKNGKYFLPPEQAMALADDNSTVYLHGAYQVMRSIFKDEDKFIDMFKTGKGLRWSDHHNDLFEGTASFFKPNYISNLTKSWIPSLDGVKEKLEKGAKVADIGCGYGISTIIMAKEFPNSIFFGFDNHLPSIEKAKQQARLEGLEGRVKFMTNSANESLEGDFDFITFFDCLHDMGDPVGAMKQAWKSLKSDGTCMIVEPMANDKLEDNLNLVGKTFFAASTLVCVPNSVADHGPALGAQAGEIKIRDIIKSAGFTRFRRSAQTPFNIIYEVKK